MSKALTSERRCRGAALQSQSGHAANRQKGSEVVSGARRRLGNADPFVWNMRSASGSCQDGCATRCSIAPNTLIPSAPLISMRIVSPYCMKPVFGAPLSMVSMARFSAMHE